MRSNTQIELGSGIYLADINGDDIDELIVVHDRILEVFQGGFQRRLMFHHVATSPIEHVLVGDFVTSGRESGTDQLLVTMSNGTTDWLAVSDDRTELWWGLSQGRIVERHERAVVGDFDGDGADEILAINPRTNGTRLVRKRGFFQDDQSYRPGNLDRDDVDLARSIVVAGEFNGDNDETDLLVIDTQERRAHRFAGVVVDGRITFHWAFSTASNSLPPVAAVATGNIDGGDRDGIVVWELGNGGAHLFAPELDGGGLRRITTVDTRQIPPQLRGERRTMTQRRSPQFRDAPDDNRRHDLLTYSPRTDLLIQTEARFNANSDRQTYWWSFDGDVRDYDEARRFGYQRQVLEARHPRGRGQRRMWDRPTVVVLVDKDGGTPLANGADFYDSYFFDPTQPDSVGATMAGMGAGLRQLLPVQRIRLTASESMLNATQRAPVIVDRLIDQVGERAILEASRTLGDGDATVETNEISIVVVDDGDQSNASRRGFYSSRRLRVDCRVAFIGHQASLTLAAHELLHDWGTHDIYGADRRNWRLSLMAGSRGGIDDRQMWLPDPWHRTQLGLTRPFLVDMSRQRSGTVQVASPASDIANSAVLFWDSSRGRRSQIYAEFRSSSPLDGVATLDRNVIDGFVVWQANLDRRMSPFETASLTVPTGTDKSVYSMDREGVRGGNKNWRDGDTTGPLTWLGGDSTGLRLSFRSTGLHTSTISWARS